MVDQLLRLRVLALNQKYCVVAGWVVLVLGLLTLSGAAYSYIGPGADQVALALLATAGVQLVLGGVLLVAVYLASGPNSVAEARHRIADSAAPAHGIGAEWRDTLAGLGVPAIIADGLVLGVLAEREFRHLTARDTAHARHDAHTQEELIDLSIAVLKKYCADLEAEKEKRPD